MEFLRWKMKLYYETDNFKHEFENLRWKWVQKEVTKPPSGPPGLWLNGPTGANLVRSHLDSDKVLHLTGSE